MSRVKNLDRDDPKAKTLFGRKPRRPIVCIGCGQKAEPFQHGYCWMCVHDGTMGALKASVLRLKGNGRTRVKELSQVDHAEQSASEGYEPKIYKLHL